MVAKVVGAQCKVLKITYKDAKDYSLAASEIYTPIRDLLIATFRDKFNIRPERNEAGVDITIAKITRDPIFKACVLDMLVVNSAGVSAAIAGEGFGRPRLTQKQDALVRDDLTGSTGQVIQGICEEVARTYNLNLESLLRGFNILVTVVYENTYDPSKERKVRQGRSYTPGPRYVAAPVRGSARPSSAQRTAKSGFRQSADGDMPSSDSDEQLAARKTRPRTGGRSGSRPVVVAAEPPPGGSELGSTQAVTEGY
jgi:hypothetical protein